MKESTSVTIGVLALQGGVREHIEMLVASGANVKEVRVPADLDGIDGLVMPGGESTAIGRLIDKNRLRQPLAQKIAAGMPAWGTCAGAILLAQQGSEFSLGLLDLDVARNAYGSQLESFVATVDVKGLKKPFEAVFIRAPQFCRIGEGVETLAVLHEKPIFVRQRNLWASSFHPELSGDPAIHRLFTEFCRQFQNLV